VKYAFIRDELARACTVRMACRMLEVSSSGYYRSLKAPVAARKARRLAVEDAVVRIHAESRRIYGAPRIAHELPRLGVSAHRNTVSRIMQEHGTRAKSARKWRPTTTQSGHGLGASPDLLGRDFGASGPNQKWLCDITYIPTDDGFLYLAGVMDAWSRSIVGWRMSGSLHATVALDALRMAVARMNPPRGPVHHSDRGVQYACRECRELLEEQGMAQR
jgi:transposase InsO family protein